MPLLTEISPQDKSINYEKFNYLRTPEIFKNTEVWPKFLETMYNIETSWVTMTAKPQRTKKRIANPYNIVIVHKSEEAIDQLITDKANCIDIENSVEKSDNSNVSTTNAYEKEDTMVPFGPIFGKFVRNNKQEIPVSEKLQNDTMRYENTSIDVVDANEKYQNTNPAQPFLNRITIKVVNIEKLQSQTTQIQNSVSIQPANSSSTAPSLDLEEIFLQDVEMTDLDSTNVFNIPNLKTPVNNNTLQYNSAVDLDRYCLGCKRKLTLENNGAEMPNAKRPRIELPVQSNACFDLEIPNRNKPQSASAIPTVVSRNISSNSSNILLPATCDYRNENRPNNVPIISRRNNKRRKDKRRKHKSSIADSHNLDLNVEITTTNRRYLSFPQTLLIKEELTTLILQITNTNSELGPNILVPRFKGIPVHAEGMLKLWCEDTATLIWLKNAIHLLPVPGVVLKRQCDKFIRIQFIKAGIFMPWIYYEKNENIQVLEFMNPWAAVSTWPIYSAQKSGEYILFTVGIPFEIIGQIMIRNYIMQFVMGTVRVLFYNGKELVETPHDIVNGPSARALLRRWRQQCFPIQTWAPRLPPHLHQFNF